MAQLKAAAHLQNLMLQEATTAAYQDVFLISAAISLITIVPGLLRKPVSGTSRQKAEHGASERRTAS